MESVLNIDLLWVGIAVAGAGTLGASIYFSDPKSATSRAFALFASASILWSIANFASARFTEPTAVLWLIRLVLFCATWHAFSFFVLARQFPQREKTISPKLFWGLLCWAATISLVTLTPLVYQSVTKVSPSVETQTGPGIALFGLTVFGFIGAGIWSLSRRFFSSSGAERRQMEFVLTGMVLTFAFLVTFDFLFPAVLNNPTLVPFGGLFLLPFIGGTAYSILRYRLFNPQVAIFGLLTFFLATATFFDVLFSASAWLILYRVAELTLVLTSGIWLLRSIVREFELERELKEINQRQEGLIHFIGHEVKNFLAKAQNTFSLMIDGDLGQLPDTMRPFAERALKDTRDGVESVGDILKASNLKKGTTEFKKEPFDLKALVTEAVEKEKQSAEQKNLALILAISDSLAGYTFVGDRGEIGDHVLKNLIENSLNYTPSGKVEVSLKRDGAKYVITVADTGVGISEEDKKRLFTEGGHGKDSQKINVHSTGYGLFIVKKIVTDHAGTVRAESAGTGKGSQFIVELPA